MEMPVEVAICRVLEALDVFCYWMIECKDDIALSWVIAEMENGKLQPRCRPGFINPASLITAGS